MYPHNLRITSQLNVLVPSVLHYDAIWFPGRESVRLLNALLGKYNEAFVLFVLHHRIDCEISLTLRT